MRRTGKYAAVALLLGVPAAARDLPSGAAAGGGAAVHVTVSNLRSGKGMVMACLTANPAKFPKCRDDPAAHRAQVAAAGADQIVFRGVQPGRYAIALLHDENGNGKADRAMSMIPREGFGFSRDAKVHMGPPHFNDAAFTVSGRDQRMTITMRYML